MKRMIAILLAGVTHFAVADEPSVAWQCQTGFTQFRLADSARFDVCPTEKGGIEVDIVSVGGNYHTCWWHTKPAQRDGKYSSKEQDCEVNFTIDGETLAAEFTGLCRYFCGARAGFRNGNYIDKTRAQEAK